MKVSGAYATEAKYGLPKDVRFCRSCVISNQRPNSTVEFRHTADSKKATIAFDSNGVCDACRFAERKKDIDWEARQSELLSLCDRFRSRNGSFDCIVPGSGGKDSFYAAHILKYRYAMNPLTVTWAPHLYTEWGWRNFQRWLAAGFENILTTPNPRVHRLLTRLAVDNLFHPFQPFMIGQKLLAPKMALQHNIPLVFFGENEAEYGNPISDATEAKRSASYFCGSHGDVHLGGVPLNKLKSDYGLNQSDLASYLPAEDVSGIDVRYLGYYLKWHPQSCYYYAVEHGGFEASPERTTGTYSKYNSIDDKIDDFHYYTTFIKFGIGRATYDAAQEVRSGDITREEAIALVSRFDGEWPARFAYDVFSYLSIPPDQYPVASKMFEHPTMNKGYFDSLADSFRSPHLWKYDHGWKLRHNAVSEQGQAA